MSVFQPINSTPLANRRPFMFQPPLLSPIQSVSSIDCDSEVEEFINRGAHLKKSLKWRNRKVADRSFEKRQSMPDMELDQAPRLLDMKSDVAPKHSDQPHFASNSFAADSCTTYQPAPPAYKVPDLVPGACEHPLNAVETMDGDDNFPAWSQDECADAPWTKAGQREYTLKRKAVIQKKKTTKKIDRQTNKKSTFAMLKDWLFRKD